MHQKVEYSRGKGKIISSDTDEQAENVQSVYECQWTLICQTRMIITYFIITLLL